MTTMTEVDTLEEAVFTSDSAIPCQMLISILHDATCDEPATWRLVTSCPCGRRATYVICEHHHDKLVFSDPEKAVFVCPTCSRASRPPFINSLERL